MPPISTWRQSRGERPVAISPRHNVIDSFSTPLLYEPGQGWAYGCGLDWAGLLVARLSGTSLEEYMESNIFKPLNMTSTTFHLENKPYVRDRLMPIQQRQASGSFKPLHPKGPPGPAVDEKGGGGLYSCVPDFMAVLSDLLRETPTLLRKETVDMLFSPQLPSESSPLKALKESFPLFAPMIGGIPATVGLNHGLGGLLVMEDVEVGGKEEGGMMKAGTMTWGGAGNLVWFCNRKEGVAGMYASQVFPPGDGKSTELIRAFIREVWRLTGMEREAVDERMS
jgi:CubicO group peptidase (beta-lactamase class C family)